ncbi:MAG: GNAT family N-acetyltransferase [Planctomycetota bacterium]|nr:MAG: GNAT family N-acetyltransferase [Planctomycetota bacterium]
MTTPKLICIDSLAELRSRAGAWDDLWWRSPVPAPSARAALVEQWLAQFAPRAPLFALAVELDGQLVAALPLFGRRRCRLLKTASLPINDWSANGDLLVDPLADVDAVLGKLVDGIQRLPVGALCFEQFATGQPHWLELRRRLEEAGYFCDVHKQYFTSQTTIGDDWDAYLKPRTGGQMKTRLRHARKMEREGGVELRTYTEFSPGEVERLMRLGFEIEAKSWKRANGTAVVQRPEIAEFYIRNARQLAEWGQLALFVFEFDGTPIAFDYAWHAKGCHFCVKMGYDAEYRKFGPGQQMYLKILERLHGDPEFDLVDFWGRRMPWNETWATHFYAVGRLVAARRPHPLGCAFVAAYRYARPLVRRLRGADDVSRGNALPPGEPAKQESPAAQTAES